MRVIVPGFQRVGKAHRSTVVGELNLSTRGGEMHHRKHGFTSTNWQVGETFDPRTAVDGSCQGLQLRVQRERNCGPTANTWQIHAVRSPLGELSPVVATNHPHVLRLREIGCSDGLARNTKTARFHSVDLLRQLHCPGQRTLGDSRCTDSKGVSITNAGKV